MIQREEDVCSDCSNLVSPRLDLHSSLVVKQGNASASKKERKQKSLFTNAGHKFVFDGDG